MKRKVRLTESDLHRVVKESVNRVLKESGPTKRFDYNQYEKAARIENLIWDIQKKNELLSAICDDPSEFGGRMNDVMSFAEGLKRLLDEYGFIDGGFNSDDYYEYNTPENDARDLGYYGTDRNGNWIYNRDENDKAYQYWLNKTMKGRKYARNNG